MALKGCKKPEGSGRKKGTSNHSTIEVKNMVLQALSNVGGAAYLQEQADKNPNAFMTLLGKVMPMQVTGAGEGPLEITITRRVVGAVQPDAD